MKLSEAINITRYSELNTLSVKDNDVAIVGFINLGLIELYNLFALRTEEHLIELEDGVTIYDLPKDFMYLTGAFEAPPLGSPENGRALPINEENNPYSVNTINFTQVQVPLTAAGAYISLMYVPKPPMMSVDDLDAELPIPDQLIQPLFNFIAFKGHGAVNVDGQGEADIYYMRFKRSCEDIKKQGTGIAPDDLSMHTRIRDRGFV